MIDVGCHRDLEQCPVHQHLAFRFVKHESFNFAGTWGRSHFLPGAPHHTRFRVARFDVDVDTLAVEHGEQGLLTFTLHEHGPEHGHEVVDVDGVPHARYPTPWNADQSHQLISMGQRAAASPAAPA